jgi:shikimate kinase
MPPLLFLIGYRGSGKSTVAELLAERLGWGWIDADERIEQLAGRSIRDIFADEGEAGFRARETEALEQIAILKQQVVATGGGVILRPENRRLLKAGTVVWLWAPVQVLWQRLQEDTSTAQRRPNLAQGGLAEIESLLKVRTPLYEACADYRVDTGAQSPAAAADAIYHWLGK